MTGDRRGRGQTTIDYAVGVGLFLLVVAFVFAFLPSIFAPFSGDSGTLPVLTDRGADRLSSDLLVESPRRPAALNATCTEGFFDADGSVPAGCRYATDGDDLAGALGVDAPAISINVTVGDGTGARSLDGTELSAGPAPPSNADAVTARRIVFLEGESGRLTVRMW